MSEGFYAWLAIGIYIVAGIIIAILARRKLLRLRPDLCCHYVQCLYVGGACRPNVQTGSRSPRI
jgi:hypothetical protein